MIEKLRLVNFQAFEDSTFEFSNGINIIIGESDKGKTSVVRALDFCIRNTTDDYIRTGQDKVEVIVDDVKRLRTKSKNEYYFKDEQLKAFGVNPPDSVIDYFQMDNYLNWQLQHDPVFLLSDKGGEVARKLNKLVNLEVIISSQKKVNADIKEIRNRKKYNEEEIDNLKEKIQSLDFVEELKAKQELFDKGLIAEEKTIITLNFLNKLHKEFKECNEAIRKLNKQLKLKTKLEIINNKKSKIESIQSQIKIITEKKEKLKELKTEINKYKEIEKHKGLIEKMKINCHKCMEITTQINNLNYFLNSHRCNEKETNDLIEKIKTLKSQIPEICPTCGGALWK